MVAQINVIALNLAATSLESILYGIFFVLTVIAVSPLIQYHGRAASTGPNSGLLAKVLRVLRSPLFLASIVIYATVTAHLIVAIRRLYDAFLYFMHGEAPMLYFSELGAKTNVAEIAQVEIAALAGDLIIIYRVWVVWSRDYRLIIFPCLTALGLVATGVGVTYQLSREEIGADVYGLEVNRWIISNAICTLCTNLYGTFMIAYRLWTHDRRMREFPMVGRSLMDVLIVIAESAAIYTAWTLFFFIAYQCKSLLHSLVISCWPVMSGISFMLILARVGWTRESRRFERSTTTANSDSWAAERRQGPMSTVNSYPLGTLQFKVSSTMEEGDHTAAKSSL